MFVVPRSNIFCTAPRWRTIAAATASTTSSAQQPKFQVGSTTLQQLQEHKEQEKEKRSKRYQASVHRVSSVLPHRRDTKKKNFLKNQFREYFDKLESQHSFWEREAKRLQLPWNIQVGLLLERLPVVTTAIPQWEDDFLTLSDELDGKTTKIYPKELGMADPTDYTVATMDEIYASLPEGYTPAPRITHADEAGIIQTLDRKLDERIYLVIRSNTPSSSSSSSSSSSVTLATAPTADPTTSATSSWMVPTAQVTTTSPHPETLLDAAKKALKRVAGSDMQVRFLSACPLAVQMIPYPTKDTFYGDKIFYIKGSYESGSLRQDLSKTQDWAWLTRQEMVQRINQDHGHEASLFYHYLM